MNTQEKLDAVILACALFRGPIGLSFEITDDPMQPSDWVGYDPTLQSKLGRGTLKSYCVRTTARMSVRPLDFSDSFLGQCLSDLENPNALDLLGESIIDQIQEASGERLTDDQLKVLKAIIS